MTNNTSNMFLIGGIILILVSNMKLMYSSSYMSAKDIWCSGMMSLVGVLCLIISLFWREYYEKYSPDFPYVTGKIIGGTVFASYPNETPGLGWVL